MPRKAKAAVATPAAPTSVSAVDVDLDPTSEAALANSRRHVRVEPERIRDVSSVDYPGHFPDEDHSWDLNRFRKGLKVQVTRLSNRSVEFDLVGVDASIANAFRRILIAEVPTVTIEHVYVWNNTSVMQDEVLSHRLGLIPLNVDPALLEMKSPDDAATDRNTLVFRLQASCTRNPNAPKGSTDHDELFIGHQVTAGALAWAPAGDQEVVFAGRPPAPTNPDIVLDKLRPGQELDLELHAVKGVGKDHAKFSPVATASYRLLPRIELNSEKPVPPELAHKFAACFARGAIVVDPVTKAVSVDAFAARRETVSREVFRHPEFDGCVKLQRVRDYFLFNIESEGAYAPERLFLESISVMKQKISALRKAALALKGSFDAEDVEMADA